ncbi:tRNA (adenosine(37)-N6)-dimethylallyltransferase MiaA [Syntrophomonas wolfei]|uniref:tRNA dimethylallyltransferase n=1 Tax=Syntrophomonas wolfei subsp. wolfei (strain DSM 2245B / Goettingen) TaxID=335541 RepID=MIAA_SYNWW|nr:tRNA (adenosine(37)-N6)-dimethylallyltransferase MiaA [Syntrophomonas wolfei]Q0AYB0.1 RecName: Full=tRNA dimethylallyltransferase; AltName: Full=Dimethylallyl diphosphate:tRNA dimethylallyltransferase; Short=DMAPP:tRNA dimethylallyltransferase; Short=DMATase; AltName: Full=Isopentenyl-diphosphate:tRNA isopentenyltransferase; Short=IPP transferase; Short=IPPT; Short=IPTase [Syntrophomonas wolfei subsp. wolfei str. Goettingen G311]ABI68294.1 tRNA isopentenyltransferase [Syntrophomonas wolfei sub
MYKLAAIVGPTAVGKTNISLEVARQINGEIISCDSMQLYRGMNIGTAKASKEEQNIVAHHLIDIADPHENFTVARYQSLVKDLISTINARGKIPILVGGTGLYYQSVVDDYTFFPMEVRQSIRDKWNAIIQEKGLPHVYRLLEQIDPAYAQIISPNDQKRVVRALEVYELTGKAFSTLQDRAENTYYLAVVGLYLERRELYARIERRVDEMIKKGLIEEVAALREKGIDLSYNSMQALGYKQVFYFLEGFINREELLNEIKRETRRYAKRQLTWFKKDQRIKWFNVGDFSDEELLVKNICTFMEGQFGIV